MSETVIETSRRCKICGRLKPIQSFRKNPNWKSTGGYSPVCNECTTKKTSETRIKRIEETERRLQAQKEIELQEIANALAKRVADGERTALTLLIDAILMQHEQRTPRHILQAEKLEGIYTDLLQTEKLDDCAGIKTIIQRVLSKLEALLW